MSTRTISLEPVLIHSPAETVWEILTDLDGYPDWNPFTPCVESTLRIGAPVTLHIRRGKSASPMTFILEVLDPPREIAWRLPKIVHKAVFNAYRTQRITPVDEQSCTYETSDTFDGWLAGPLYDRQIEWVLKNFNRLATALKERAEKRYAEQC